MAYFNLISSRYPNNAFDAKILFPQQHPLSPLPSKFSPSKPFPVSAHGNFTFGLLRPKFLCLSSTLANPSPLTTLNPIGNITSSTPTTLVYAIIKSYKFYCK